MSFAVNRTKEENPSGRYFKNVSIQLQREGEKPLYAQIAAALKEAIDAGQLPADSRLPSIRTLAAQLQVNAVTVVNAYRELELEGYVWSRTGSGTYVRSSPPAKPPVRFSSPHQGINFASATPTPEIFPVGDFKRLLNLVLDRDGGHAFGYQESQGWPPLREAMQEYLGQIGIAARLENIHIISGAQQGIDLAAKILVRHGDTVLVESPTYHGAIATFRSRGSAHPCRAPGARRPRFGRFNQAAAPPQAPPLLRHAQFPESHRVLLFQA